MGVARNGDVYVTDRLNHRVQYFTPNGSFLGKWGTLGSGNAEFERPRGVAVAPGGNVYVADRFNHRIQYFTSTGSFLGKWGSLGSGNGQFKKPPAVAITPNGAYVYVTDCDNDRVQYFRWSPPAVAPASLGRVKALFR